jgi:hypothetical protein
MAETAVAATRFLRGAVSLIDIVITPFMGRGDTDVGSKVPSAERIEFIRGIRKSRDVTQSDLGAITVSRSREGEEVGSAVTW